MRAFLLFVTIAALAVPAGADHCTEPAQSEHELNTCVANVAAPCFYFDNDACQPECGFNVWIYQESNGVPGLQRGDEYTDDTCHEMVPADTIIF